MTRFSDVRINYKVFRENLLAAQAVSDSFILGILFEIIVVPPSTHKESILKLNKTSFFYLDTFFVL